MSLAEKPAHKAIGERPLGGQRGRCVFVAVVWCVWVSLLSNAAITTMVSGNAPELKVDYFIREIIILRLLGIVSCHQATAWRLSTHVPSKLMASKTRSVLKAFERAARRTSRSTESLDP